jgi:hypothetical protein
MPDRPSIVRATQLATRLVFAVAGAMVLWMGVSSAAPSRIDPGTSGASAGDPLVPLLLRIHAYFQGHEVDGVAMDSRYAINPTEAIRMSVVCQLLGYAQLYRIVPTCTLRQDVLERAMYLVPRLSAVSSGSPFDGMLGASLMDAYDITHDAGVLDAADYVEQELEAIPTESCVLNGGLMVAMSTADDARRTGRWDSAQKTADILAQLVGFQNADGSFAHWCWGSEDIHYTGWMAQELVYIQRVSGDTSTTAPMLRRMRDFILTRLDSTGVSHYEQVCPDYPGCMRYYDSRRSGCTIDYDTRAWTVEPGYNALLLDHHGEPMYAAAMRELLAHEDHGTFADKWDFIPPPSDPEYPWSIADTSVANMSIIFWTLSMIVAGRPDAVDLLRPWLNDGTLGADSSLCRPVIDAGDGAPRVTALALGPAAPNPTRAGCRLALRLPAAAVVELEVFDLLGRRVRTLAAGPMPAGVRDVAWDGLDARGSTCRGGLYMIRLRAGGEVRSTRVLLLR